jgi:hypothetical protein
MKPTPPPGYKMLEEGKDMTTVYDLIWAIDKNGKSQRWAHAILETDEGIKMASDTHQTYVEPKNVEDYCFFRCKKQL